MCIHTSLNHEYHLNLVLSLLIRPTVIILLWCFYGDAFLCNRTDVVTFYSLEVSFVLHGNKITAHRFKMTRV